VPKTIGANRSTDSFVLLHTGTVNATGTVVYICQPKKQ